MILTVFTPTYNRANTLKRLFISLKKQNFKDFEWLIVDDGSIDNTSEIVKSFDSDGEFPIRYIKKENGGKHTAYNIGLEEAKGLLFFNVDSDDWLPDNSLETISNYVTALFSDDNLAGIVALKKFANDEIIGKKFISDKTIASLRSLELSGQSGERSLVFKTNIARKFPFPIVKEEKFMPESVVYDKFVIYEFVVINKELTTCEYQQDGLSSNPKQLMLKNPGGYMLYYRKRIDMAATLKERIGYVLRYNFSKGMYNDSLVASYKGRYELLIAMMKLLNPIVAKYY